MAEAVLNDIVDQIEQESEADSKVLTNNASIKFVKADKDDTIASDKEEVNEVLRKQKPELEELDNVHTETDKEVESESDLSDDIPTDDNNDLLTTEEEAEDFLKHVLRDTNDSDQDVEKSKQGLSSCDCIGETLDENEERLKIASALINFGSAQSTVQEKHVLTSEQISGKEFGVELKATIRQPVDQDLNSFSNTSSIDINCSKNDVPIVNTCSLLNSDISLDVTKSICDSNKMPTVSDVNNNDTVTNSCNNLTDDSGLFKYDWSKCFNPYNISDTRSLSTPDTEMDNISPDLSCMMQLSPTATYGKDHVIGCQRLYSRQNLQSVGCSSTLNTPDPILYEDTDSNESNMTAFRKYNTCMAENTSAWSEVDINNNTDGASKGMKRKHSDMNEKDGSSNILSDTVVTSIMNQGRPPDISTWRAVNSSFDTQGNFVNDDLDGQWNKPTCTVQPFQNTGQYNNSYLNGSNTVGTNQQAYTSTAYSPYNFTGMNQSQYSQYTNPLFRPACQFTPNQSMDSSAYRPHLYNSGFQGTAAFRLDFSSPVNDGTPGVLNFVSHPQYLGVNLTRPRAIHANNLHNSGYSSGFSYSPLSNIPVLNSGGFRNYYPSYNSQVVQQVPVQSPYLNPLNQTTTTSRTPSATQTFLESLVNNNQATTVDNGLREQDVNVNDNRNSDVNNNCKKLNVENNVTEKCESLLDCDECGNILENSEQEMVENDVSKDTEDKLHATKVNERKTNKDGSQAAVGTVKQGKALGKCIQSNEADSTTIDLTGDTIDVNEGIGVDIADSPMSPTPAHSCLKVQNKYFTEIYLKKNIRNSPISSFCSALDLSKREEKKDIKKATKPLVTLPQNIRPYCEPPIPVSAVMNSIHAPALAYSGAMLVPYMNSIFTAMASLNKNQTVPSIGSVSNFTNPNVNMNAAQDGQNTTSDSPLTQINDLTLNQQVLMYSNLQANLSALKTSGTTDSNGGTAINSAAGNAQTLNVNSLPLPLYAAPLHYPVRPLQQGLVNPCMFR